MLILKCLFILLAIHYGTHVLCTLSDAFCKKLDNISSNLEAKNKLQVEQNQYLKRIADALEKDHEKN